MNSFMSLKNLAAFMAVALFALNLPAQNVSLSVKNVPIILNGDELTHAFAGGMNSPQFSSVDLNNDGLQDVYVFDRVGNVQMTFLRQGDGALLYAPEFTTDFPDFEHWVLLRDFNGDGAMDAFSSNDSVFFGVRVHQGYYEDGKLAFRRLDQGKPAPVLYYTIPPNTQQELKLYVTEIDYPAIDDLDCDGDLDLLTFQSEGGFVEFFRNMSVENGHGLDSLIFVREDACWGGIYETGVSTMLDLASAPGECAFDGITGDLVSDRHVGSSLTTLDIDGDSDKDLLLGDFGFSNINLSINGGSCGQAWMNDQDATFPSGGESAIVETFPTAYHLDIDHDGHRDLIVSPNEKNNAADYECVWLYRNLGTDDLPDFQFQKNTFLVDEMLDMGTGTSPAALDYNADGLMDLVVGNFSFHEQFGQKNTRLYLLENIGSANAPSFELVDDDYLDMNQFSSSTYNLAPTFGDLDGDGDLDAIVGEQFGRLFYFENTAGPGNPVDFATPQYGYMDINVGQATVPQIIDLNRDGLPDLIVGERGGNVNYFQNQGSTSAPSFGSDEEVAPNVKWLGDVDTRIAGFTTGYSAPWFVDLEGAYRLFVGTRFGQIEVYGDIEGQLEDGDIFSSLSENLGRLRAGEFVHPILLDWDNDQFLDLMVGNYRGGLNFYSTNLEVSGVVDTDAPLENDGFTLAPNPARDFLQVHIDQPALWQQARILSIDGKMLWEQGVMSATTLTLPTNNWPAGIYYLQLTGKGGSDVKRFVISR